MATGEWIHDYLNRNGNGVKRNKSINNGQRLYVATQQGMQNLPPPMQNLQQPPHHDSKKSIKRSWTISSKLYFENFPIDYFYISIVNCKKSMRGSNAIPWVPVHNVWLNTSRLI